MLRFTILGSGSSGNCAYLETDHTRILVDAGFSAKQIELRLASIGRSLSDVQAIFITHEHSDHVCGLPVLTRGPNDQGVAAQSNLLPPEPTLTGVTPPNNQPSARLGDIVSLTGYNLDGSDISVLLAHPLLDQPEPVNPNPGGTATSLAFQIPNTPAALPAGFYTVTVMVQRPGETFQRATNAAPLALAPTATLSPASAPAGAIAYTAAVSPQVLPAQRASLLLGATEILADQHLGQTGALTFAASDVAAGDYWFRIRVDGVDTLLVDRTKTPPAYDLTQQGTVTP